MNSFLNAIGEGLLSQLPLEISLLVISAGKDAEHFNAVCTAKSSREEVEDFILATGKKVLIWIESRYPEKAKLQGIPILVLGRRDFDNKVKIVCADSYTSVTHVYTSLFTGMQDIDIEGTPYSHRLMFSSQDNLKQDIISEYQTILHQREICTINPQIINRHLVRRYNNEIAPPIGDIPTNEDIKRAFILRCMMQNYSSSRVVGKTVDLVTAPRPGIVMIGQTEFDYEANIRVIRDEVIRLTGAVPHAEDELYLVY